MNVPINLFLFLCFCLYCNLDVCRYVVIVVVVVVVVV